MLANPSHQLPLKVKLVFSLTIYGLGLASGLIASSRSHAQTVLHLTAWEKDAFASKEGSEAISSSTAPGSISGGRAKASIKCVRKDTDGKTKFPSSLLVTLDLSSTAYDVDVQTIQHSKWVDQLCPGGPVGLVGPVPCFGHNEYYNTTERNVYMKERVGESDVQNFTIPVAQGRIDSLFLSREIATFTFGEGLGQHLYGFTSRGKDYALSLNPQQPAIKRFLAACEAPSIEQSQLLKDIVAREEAAAKAEAVRREEEKIAAAKAAEEARIAAENARIAREVREAELREAAAAHEKLRSDAIAAALGTGNHVGSQSQWATLLVGKTVVPLVTVGKEGRMKTDKYWTPAKTEIFPSGKEHFVIPVLLFGDLLADQYKSYLGKPELVVRAVELKKDCLELKLQINSVGGDPADIKLMLGKDWQNTKSNQDVIRSLENAMSINY